MFPPTANGAVFIARERALGARRCPARPVGLETEKGAAIFRRVFLSSIKGNVTVSSCRNIGPARWQKAGREQGGLSKGGAGKRRIFYSNRPQPIRKGNPDLEKINAIKLESLPGVYNA